MKIIADLRNVNNLDELLEVDEVIIPTEYSILKECEPSEEEIHKVISWCIYQGKKACLRVDRVIEEIYAIVYAENGKEVTRQKIEKKRGTLDFVDLYLNTQKYSIKLEVLYYKTEEDTLLSKYSSEAVTTEIVEVKDLDS